MMVIRMGIGRGIWALRVRLVGGWIGSSVYFFNGVG